jgi:hypothetical protein
MMNQDLHKKIEGRKEKNRKENSKIRGRHITRFMSNILNP